MKLILLQHVKGVGEKGAVVEVSDGYAQNALIPRGLAKAATDTELNKIKQAKKSKQEKQAKEKGRVLKLLGLINGKTVTITEKTNEKGTLYHALGLKEVIRAVHDQLQVSIPNNIYKEKYAIKELGQYEIELEAYGKRASFYLVISSK